MYTQKEVDDMLKQARESRNDGSNRQLTDNETKNLIAELSRKIGDIDMKAYQENRALTGAEAGLRIEMEASINELRKNLPEKPLTLQNSLGSQVGAGQATAPMGRDYRSMFNKGHRGGLDTGGFQDCAEFLRVMDSGRYDPRLQIRASMGEGVPSSGGFSVPSQFASEWLDASLPTEIVRNLARVYPMTSETLDVPGWDGADMSGGKTHGGLEMVFMAEGAIGTPQTAKMRQITLTARMAGIYVDASIELIQDGKDFATNLQTALRQSLGYGIDRYCLTGSGAGCPQGVLEAPCKIQVAGETGQTPDTLVYQNIKKMFARQLNPGNAVWLFNNSVIPDLLEVSVAVGIGGTFVPLLNETNGKFTIFGRPVYFHPSMPAIGDADDCAFVDFNFYALGLRAEIWVDITDAVRWTQRERSFRILMRFDGQSTLNAAVTPEHGTTMSPIVTMAAR
jgi:HK97 family phage major capsid protein